jgi:cyclopropane fatty-acyl-phospholipid synthase-like methyltransferase
LILLQQVSFDSYAGGYDAHFTHSLIGKGQRAIVHKYLSSLADQTRSVLEVNCGTGEDAVFLSALFEKIMCTDASEEMIKISRDKLGEIKNVECKTISMQRLKDQITGGYHLIFSNFGGINCLSEAEVKVFSETCAFLGAKDSEIVMVIMGKKCLWERFYFNYKKDKQNAVRRSGNAGVPTRIMDSVFQTYYYSPAHIAQLFSKHFKMIGLKPVGFFIPPSYLNAWAEKHPSLFSVLCKMEKVSAAAPFLSDYADHYLIHLKRK